MPGRHLQPAVLRGLWVQLQSLLPPGAPSAQNEPVLPDKLFPPQRDYALAWHPHLSLLQYPCIMSELRCYLSSGLGPVYCPGSSLLQVGVSPRWKLGQLHHSPHIPGWAHGRLISFELSFNFLPFRPFPASLYLSKITSLLLCSLPVC